MTVGDTCRVKLCRRPAVLDYYGKPTCQQHWNYHCRQGLEFNLKKEFRIKENHCE